MGEFEQRFGLEGLGLRLREFFGELEKKGTLPIVQVENMANVPGIAENWGVKHPEEIDTVFCWFSYDRGNWLDQEKNQLYFYAPKGRFESGGFVHLFELSVWNPIAPDYCYMVAKKADAQLKEMYHLKGNCLQRLEERLGVTRE